MIKRLTPTYLIYFTFLLITGCHTVKSDLSDNYEWIQEIQEDHPRLYFNEHTFPAVKKRALNEERDIFEKMQHRVDTLLGKEIEFQDSLIRDGNASRDHTIGNKAAEAAFD